MDALKSDTQLHAVHMKHVDSRISPLLPLNVRYNRTCRVLF